MTLATKRNLSRIATVREEFQDVDIVALLKAKGAKTYKKTSTFFVLF
jgi:hypothetical protein